MAEQIRILILGIFEGDVLLIIEELRRGGYDPEFVGVAEPVEMDRALTEMDWDLIIADHSVSGFSVVEVLASLKNLDKRIPFIVISEKIAIGDVVDFIKSGVADCIPRDDLARLVPAVERELKGDEKTMGSGTTDFDLEERNKMMMSMLEDVENLHGAAEREKEKLAVAISAMDESIILFDPSGNVVLHNTSAAELFGDGLGSSINRDALLANEWFPHEEVVNKSLKGAERFDADVIISKEPFLAMNIVSVPIGDGGFLVTVSDITKERELVRAKDELITTVSHELRTPLTMIKLFFSNAMAGVMGEYNEKMSRAIDRANMSVSRLSLLIDELLDYSRLERGAVQLSINPSFVSKIVNDISILFDPISSAKNRKFKTRIEVRDESIMLDEHRVHQVLTNLIDNAMKFTSDGGHIELIVRDDDENISFLVVDDGEGIAPQFLETVFDRFKQVGRTYGPGIKGLGLGLAICREIAEAHKGKIWVESELGEGSKFILRLPREVSIVDADTGEDDWTLS